MDKPFEVGEKVRCIKQGDWHIGAGFGEKCSQNTPVYGGIYTVAYIDRLVSEVGEDDNGVEWAMTLEEFPEDVTTNEPHNVFSCRRFEKV